MELVDTVKATVTEQLPPDPCSNSPIEVTGVALGYRVYSDGTMTTGIAPSREPYVGQQLEFLAFVRVNGQEGQWYSHRDVASAELGAFTWIGNYAAQPGATDTVIRAPDEIRRAVTVQWRRFENIVRVQQGHYYTKIVNGVERRLLGGQERWYGLRHQASADYTGWRRLSVVTEGTRWWGAHVDWNRLRAQPNSNQSVEQVVFLCPSNRRENLAVYATHADPGENIVQLGTGATQTVWTESGWNGRISGRSRYADIQFDLNDPYFNGATDRQQAMLAQGALQARILEWASSFLETPYAWGGQTYGGRQSKGAGNSVGVLDATHIPDHYTCSYESHRIDYNTTLGQSRNFAGRAGHGIDCNGLVTEAAASAGVSGFTGDGPSANALRTINLARDVSPLFLAPGDFLATSGHTAYYRGNRFVDPAGVLTRADTIEADPGRPGQVRERTREDTFVRRAQKRRWIAQ